MIQNMIQGSLAIFRAQDVAAFKAHERDDLTSATLYVTIAASLSGVLAVIGFWLGLIPMNGSNAKLDQVGNLGGLLADLMVGIVAPADSLQAAAFRGVFGPLIGFAIFLGLAYVIGALFGGTGSLGELAYDIALVLAPLQVAGAVLAVIAIGPLARLTFFMGIGLLVFQTYLTFVGVQSGLNLSKARALGVMVVIALLWLLASVAIAALGIASLFISGLAPAG